MKLWIVFSLLVYGAYIYAGPTECNKRAKQIFEESKKACQEKQGEEKKTCMQNAKIKLKESNKECLNNLKDCIEKAKEEKNTAMQECKSKTGTDRKTCNESARSKFQEARNSCRKI
ncbi:MAG: hypothetical protein N3A69_14730 [Leptospiraceae bacterium]|nr:hypothetical protein [Leptospiraceae bacterium]